MAAILFGGIRRLAAVSQVIVPIMVVGYFMLAIGILIANITEVPAALALSSSLPLVLSRLSEAALPLPLHRECATRSFLQRGRPRYGT